MKKLFYLFLALTGAFILHSCDTMNAPPDDASTVAYHISISAQPPEGGTVSPKSETYKGGTKVDIKTTSTNGWRFVRWKGDYRGSSASATITVNSDMNIIGVFKKKEYKLTVNIEGKGTVDEKVIKSAETYSAGTVVKLTADPAKGWRFDRWKGDVSSSKNQIKVTITKPKTVTAVFGKKNNHIYYVATDGSNSNGNGTESDPWATITYAIDHVKDGSLILVKPGTYYGRVHLSGRFDEGITIRSAVPYQAKLRNDSRVLICFYGQGITLEGFDIAHTGLGAGDTVIQIQDLLGPVNGPSDGKVVRDIVLRNNIIHDSYNNDLVKINNGAVHILIEDNMFYNQAGVDEHLDINSVAHVVIQNNIFFNDFSGSGRANKNITQTYIAIKDSNGDHDDFVGARDVVVQRNVFLNWEGRNDGNFVQVGSNTSGYFGAFNVLIQNNLMLGHSGDQMRAAFGVISSRDVTIRFNTVVGDLPAMAYAMRLFGIDGPDSKDIRFYGNIWSDPTGTMGDFSDSPPEDTESFVLKSNLYWNGGNPIPVDNSDLVDYTDDPFGVVGDPMLPSQAGIVVPRWNPQADQFADGSQTIHEVFLHLVKNYGIPAEGSAAINAGSPNIAPRVPDYDILGRPRTCKSHADLGAYTVEGAC